MHGDSRCDRVRRSRPTVRKSETGTTRFRTPQWVPQIFFPFVVEAQQPRGTQREVSFKTNVSGALVSAIPPAPCPLDRSYVVSDA